MLEKIVKKLQEMQIPVWRINLDETESCQLYYIRRAADMFRQADAHEIIVSVFRDGDNARGMAEVKITSAMLGDEDLLTRALSEAWDDAQHAMNPFFEMPDPVVDTVEDAACGEKLREQAERLVNAVFSQDLRTDSFVNSMEVYAEKSKCRIVASNGTDITFTRYSYKGEFVVQCIDGDQDVELYRDFSYTTPDAAALKAETAEALKTVCDRVKATEAPEAGTYNVVLSGRQLATLLDIYPEKANAAYVYAKYSSYAVGTAMQGDNVTGEKLNIALRSTAPFSDEGIRMNGIDLAKNGIVQSLHGANRFCRYLGIEPKGYYDAVTVDNGTVPLAKLTEGKCLWPVLFSDFQADPFSGHFGGEIRLAYLFDESGMHIVTGGSVNGSIFDAQGNFTFSLERYRSLHYDGPMAIRIENVSVAGR